MPETPILWCPRRSMAPLPHACVFWYHPAVSMDTFATPTAAHPATLFFTLSTISSVISASIDFILSLALFMLYIPYETEQRQKGHPPSTLPSKTASACPVTPPWARRWRLLLSTRSNNKFPTCGRPLPSGPTKQQIKTHPRSNLLRCAPPHRSTPFFLSNPQVGAHSKNKCTHFKKMQL
jgi:hypothetical protein